MIEVAGCGLCHTDLGFIGGAVKTRQPLALILGHEISGRVVAAGTRASDWVGASVIVPAVLPCGECALCVDGRDNICQRQKMPGNDFNGGFAAHVVVPARYLCRLPSDLRGHTLAELSVIADAVTTPYQALKRSGLKSGDLAIVVGVGGVGVYMVQHARAAGSTVIALDVSDRKLETARAQGASYVLNVRDLGPKEIKEKIRGWVAQDRLPKYQWRIFETSGTTAGQSTAFSLLSFAGSVSIVGFTMEALSVRLSNIMAFDADLIGNWGCRPAYYPNVVELVLSEKIRIKENVQTFPLDSINEVLSDALAHKSSEARAGPKITVNPRRPIKMKSHDIPNTSCGDILFEKRPLRDKGPAGRGFSMPSTTPTPLKPCSVSAGVCDRSVVAVFNAVGDKALHRETPRSTPSTTPAIPKSTNNTCGSSTTWSPAF